MDRINNLSSFLLFSFRLQTPTIELTREDCGTPDQGYSSTLCFRSITPGLPLIEKTRRTTFPLLCSRPGSACDRLIRKKSCQSSEDVQRRVARHSCASTEDLSSGQAKVRRFSGMFHDDSRLSSLSSASLHRVGKLREGLQVECLVLVGLL